jgi:hypothetical protein
MKIAVFGDSYAVKSTPEQFKSWIDLLEESDVSVDSYGVASSPLFVSVKNFEKYHDQYDRCIFVVTNPWRLEIQGELRKYFITSSENAKRLQITNNLDQSDRDWWMLERAANWLLNSPAAFNDNLVCNHIEMIEYVRNLRKDVLLIPAFETSFPHKTVNFSLIQISNFEINSLGYKNDIYLTHLDQRVCHMTEKNNLELSNQIKNIINDKDDKFYMNKFHPMTQEEFKQLMPKI